MRRWKRRQCPLTANTDRRIDGQPCSQTQRDVVQTASHMSISVSTSAVAAVSALVDELTESHDGCATGSSIITVNVPDNKLFAASQ